MKKTLCLVLCLCLLVPALACAGKVITAMASDYNSNGLRSADVHVRVWSYNASSNTLSMDIYVPERFRRDEVESLRPGDAIYTQGREVRIKSVTLEMDCVSLNGGDILLWKDANGSSYTIFDDSSFGEAVSYLGRFNVPVTQYLSFVDNTEPDTGIHLMQPLYYNASQFISMLQSNSYPGFTSDNVTATFDEAGKLIKLTRYAVYY